MTDQSTVQPPVSGDAVPEPAQEQPPITATHTTVTIDGIEQTAAEAQVLLGMRGHVVQTIENYLLQFGRDHLSWLHGIIDAIANNLPPR